MIKVLPGSALFTQPVTAPVSGAGRVVLSRTAVAAEAGTGVYVLQRAAG